MSSRGATSWGATEWLVRHRTSGWAVSGLLLLLGALTLLALPYPHSLSTARGYQETSGSVVIPAVVRDLRNMSNGRGGEYWVEVRGRRRCRCRCRCRAGSNSTTRIPYCPGSAGVTASASSCGTAAGPASPSTGASRKPSRRRPWYPPGRELVCPAAQPADGVEGEHPAVQQNQTTGQPQARGSRAVFVSGDRSGREGRPPMARRRPSASGSRAGIAKYALFGAGCSTAGRTPRGWRICAMASCASPATLPAARAEHILRWFSDLRIP